jgi:hypothetical protein
MIVASDKRDLPAARFPDPASWSRRWESRVSALSTHAELLILCARIGFNP